jgi:hypothetical protein
LPTNAVDPRQPDKNPTKLSNPTVILRVFRLIVSTCARLPDLSLQLGAEDPRKRSNDRTRHPNVI